jgi:hypothetical protein
MSMKSAMAVSAAALFAAACGGSSSNNGSGTITGTVRGATIKVNEVLSTNATVTVSGTSAAVGAIILTSATNTCSNAAANKETKSAQYFVMALTELSLDSQGNPKFNAPTGPGDYCVYSGSGAPCGTKLAIVLSQTTDATCQEDTSLLGLGSAGTVRVTAITNGAYTGTFTIDMYPPNAQGNPDTTKTKETVTGSFSAVSCAGLGALVSTTRNTTCI